MNDSAYPDFFDAVPPLRLRDPLAAALGAARDGLLTYHYVDAVKLAGHSCPTVAGAWLMAATGLAALYGEALPERGAIAVQLREHETAGTTGVTGMVLGMLTGAAGPGGFQGLGGRFARRGLLSYGHGDLPANVRLVRRDTGRQVDLDYDPSPVPPDPEQQPLMQKLLRGEASEAERARFAELWQDRVARILQQGSELVTVR